MGRYRRPGQAAYPPTPQASDLGHVALRLMIGEDPAELVQGVVARQAARTAVPSTPPPVPVKMARWIVTWLSGGIATASDESVQLWEPHDRAGERGVAAVHPQDIHTGVVTRGALQIAD